MATCKEWTRKGPWKKFGMVSTWKPKKGKASKFVDAGGYNRNEREREREREELATSMCLQRGAEKKNKFTLGTERCENIKNLYINTKYG